MSEENVELVRRFIEAFKGGDLEARLRSWTRHRNPSSRPETSAPSLRPCTGGVME
jgi:hypothetical protein